jgi:hypothetical protein
MIDTATQGEEVGSPLAGDSDDEVQEVSAVLPATQPLPKPKSISRLAQSTNLQFCNSFANTCTNKSMFSGVQGSRR